jgi:hypothetical protein
VRVRVRVRVRVTKPKPNLEVARRTACIAEIDQDESGGARVIETADLLGVG